QAFRRNRNLGDKCTCRVEHRRSNCRSRAVHRQLANSLRAEWAVGILLFDNDGLHIRGIERSWNDVVCKPVIDDSPLVPDQLFEQSVAYSLQRASFDLARGKHRMNRATNILSSSNLLDSHFVS